MAAFSTRIGRSRAGFGLFANAPIARGAFIVEYTGKRIPTAEAHARERKTGARYMMEVNARWTIDGSARTNKARYINHSCSPNAEAVEAHGRVRIYARRRIAEGEEITTDYGRAYFELFIAEGGCRCAGCLPS